MATKRKSTQKIDVYDAMTTRIITALENGTAPWRQTWVSAEGTAKLPRNGRSKKTYRGINTFLLWLAQQERGFQSHHWLTFKQAKELGEGVKKGAKSEMVTFWKRLAVNDLDDNGQPVKKVVPMLKYYRVFNAQECNGLPSRFDVNAPEEGRSEHTPIEAAESLVSGYDGAPDVEHEPHHRPCYVPSLDVVRMPKPEAFTSGEEYYGTLFHELAHSTGHESRLNRPDCMSPKFGSEPYGKEELVAEMSATFLSALCGIETTTVENSAAYLQSWITTLRGDSKLVVQSAGLAQRAVDLMTGTVFDDD